MSRDWSNAWCCPSVLTALFGSLIAACPSDGGSEDRCGPPTDEEVEVPASAIDGVAPGTMLPLDACHELCAMETRFLLGCAVPDGSASSGETGSVTDATSGEETAILVCSFEGDGCTAGRAHGSLRSRGATERPGCLSSWLAAAAHDEAASVATFMLLCAELRALGAPTELLGKLRAAAIDEARHARIMRRLARARGAGAARPRHVAIAPRSLEAIAIENAVEGCVRETWAALEAFHQARHALDADVRDAMRGIAEDEARHAALAWELDAWLHNRLGRGARARVGDARRRAARDLVSGVTRHRARELATRGGLPCSTTALALARALAARLWA